MKRLAYAAKIKEGKKNELRAAIGSSWEALTALLDSCEITNFSIWTADCMVFIYGEAEDSLQLNEEILSACSNVIAYFDDILDWICAPGQKMRLMYQDYGIVRADKNLIRHRMFMTKLKENCAEEYKARHDKLIEARGENVDPGPDSNFTIWSDGTYIFGYDEIDTTMETEETPEEREATIAWETRQLGIMDWITDDVDWMTGERHSRSLRLAWYK